MAATFLQLAGREQLVRRFKTPVLQWNLTAMFATRQHAHFIGIGGIGMSGIAEILLNMKMQVSGSDLRRSLITDRLGALGAVIHTGHDAANVGNATVVVTSSAV